MARSRLAACCHGCRNGSLPRVLRARRRLPLRHPAPRAQGEALATPVLGMDVQEASAPRYLPGLEAGSRAAGHQPAPTFSSRLLSTGWIRLVGRLLDRKSTRL